MSDNSTYLPTYLDEPERIAIWTMDEALVLLFPIFMGMMLGYALVGFIIGAVGLTGYSRIRSKLGHHLLPGLIYWYLPITFSRFVATPPSYIREYVG